ncbi:MAG: hypothetical protein DCF22_18690, partial [Leptolyngbya sp.]
INLSIKPVSLMENNKPRTLPLWRSEAVWGGYERVLPPETLHYIGKDKMQRLERTNGIVR